MRQYIALLMFTTLAFWISSTNAQDRPSSEGRSDWGGAPPPAGGFDYFTFDKSVGSYLRILESAHVRTVPDRLRLGRPDYALAEIKFTLDRFPNHPESLQQLSMVAQMLKNNTIAVNYFQRAVANYPQYALTWAQYGLFLVSIKDIDGGIEKLLKSTEIDPKLPAAYAGLAHAYVKKGDMNKAREAAQKARELGFNGKLPDDL